jgi:tRNA 2-(methylsulfanyl)-N6-isopentenyladenosine37 hydroxylase
MNSTGKSADVQQVMDFLSCRTPAAWFAVAPDHLPELLIDHANCEKKAAGSALSLLYRYVDRPRLLQTCSKLAREELRHFEQVHALLRARSIDYIHLSSSRYAAGLRRDLRTSEPGRLVDTLLVAAVVEARSCERFSGLAEVLDDELAGFYRRLLTSEARHFKQYLSLAREYSREPITARLDKFLQRDAELVCEPDADFRFHSGPPAADTQAEMSRSAP